MAAHSLPKGTFRPLQGSRRGEAYAWALAAAMLAVTAITAWRLGSVPWFLWVMLGFFTGSALLSSFGNWVDSRTALTLGSEGVEFHNGLRHVVLRWPQVQSVRIVRDRWGQRVQVQGEDGRHFAFRTVAEVEIHAGRPQKLFGFEKGEALAQAIIRQAGLVPHTENNGEVYYARG